MMTTVQVIEGKRLIQRTIDFVDMEIAPTGDLIGKTATFYPSKRIGALMGHITAVWDGHYTVMVTSCEKKAGRPEIGKYWLCNKEATGVSYL